MLAAALVLASGERVTVSADDNADLYWAIRGGGGPSASSRRSCSACTGWPGSSAGGRCGRSSRRPRSPADPRRHPGDALPGVAERLRRLLLPGLRWYWRDDFVRELPDEAIARHVEFGKRLPTVHSTMHLYPVDGAVHDVGSGDTAFNFRDAQWSQAMVGVDPDPAKADELHSFAVDHREALHPIRPAAPT